VAEIHAPWNGHTWTLGHVPTVLITTLTLASSTHREWCHATVWMCGWALLPLVRQLTNSLRRRCVQEDLSLLFYLQPTGLMASVAQPTPEVFMQALFEEAVALSREEPVCCTNEHVCTLPVPVLPQMWGLACVQNLSRFEW
jgi:hypothetical protein